MPMDNTPGSVSLPQKSLILKLSNEKDISGLSDEQRSWLANESNLDHLSKLRASDIITKLLTLPKVPTQPAETTTATTTILKPVVNPTTGKVEVERVAENVPDQAYYFIVDPTTGRESFFRVQKGKQGTRWEGYTFLAIQASDDFYAVKDPVRRQTIFDEILKDPINAMNEYGIRLGQCGMCGRTLTDRDSRLRGIGPICAAKIPATSEQLGLLAQLGLIGNEADDNSA